MKRSKRIVLTILASTCLVAGGCGDQNMETKRNLYKSKEDCLKDWGEEDCEEMPGGYHYGPHYYYIGGRPWYFPRNTSNPKEVEPTKGFSRVAPGASSINAHSTISSFRTVRGGFGHFAGFHSIGG